ncbi:MAG: chromosome segregation protein SMC [Acidobacteriia bacterium]|nr:chromosome segregation protein SMC [Terriglobia bacterium]
MLKLTRIEMIGFKSFCDKAELMFSEASGVTAIVGPNGCGKSNIADAIAWVLGEQSVKSLRGSSMEDVIFNGTRDRQPLGLAQVSLTLVDPEFGRESGEMTPEVRQEDLFQEEQPVQETSSDKDSGPTPARRTRARRRMEPRPGEIVVTRKLYRSGESEYYLNGRQCRLRDIQELFMGTGLGPNSYAIIEQGRVGQILSSKPSDRRILIEEAAGTTKYKAKRKLAEAKLESAKLNLSRISDIIEEVTRQLNSLKRQASKARRYKELREELREKETTILFNQLVGFEETITRTQSELSQAAAQAESAQQGMRALELEQETSQQRSFELEDLLRQSQGGLSQANLEQDRAQNRIEYTRQQLEALEQRLQELENESATVAGLIGSLGGEVRTKRAEDDRLQREVQGLETEEADRVALANDSGGQLQALEDDLERLRTDLIDAVQQAATLNNQILQIDEADARLGAQRERLERELDQAGREAQAFGESRRQLTQTAGEEQTELERVSTEQAEQAAELESCRTRDAALEAALEELKRQQADAQARRHSIEEVILHHAYVDEGVKKLLTSDLTALYPGFQTMGVLADFIEVESEFEQAIEEYLKDELEFLVVESSAVAQQGIAVLRTQTGGRSTFVVDRPARPFGEEKLQPDAAILALPGVYGAVRSLVRLQGRLAEAIDQVLPLLSRAYVVDSFETADRLAQRFPEAAFVTRDGEVFRGCWIRGGRKSGAGPLALKRELRALATKLSGFEKELTERISRQEELRLRKAQIEATVQTLSGHKIDLEKRQVGSDHRMQQLDGEISRAEQKITVLRGELSRLDLERQLAREAQAASRNDLEVLESGKQAIEEKILRQLDQTRELKALKDALNLEISEMRSRLATLTERKQSSRETLERLVQQQEEVQQRQDRLNQQKTAALEEQEAMRSSWVQLEAEVNRLSRVKAELEEAIAASTREAEAFRAKLVEIDEQLKTQRETLSQLMEARSVIEVTAAKLESELAHVREDCERELDRPWEEVRLLQVARLEGEALEEASSARSQLRQRIDSMGAINMMALEEYAECEQRHTFLEAQRKDLLDSIADTTQTILEIDEVSRRQFEEAFNSINENFQETFKQLFGGGFGSMKLTDENDLQQSGIDLHVQPPGKKLQNVLLLSGGEKALTAIALLLAIFRYQPSPFCVMDEVDAPLDEANIERFTRMIGQLSGDTHFIVITHNKKTMEIARSMYGVTMQEAGVSKLVSVKFD